MFMFYTVSIAVLAFPCLILLLSFAVPFLLAVVTIFLQYHSASNGNDDGSKNINNKSFVRKNCSSILVGRVWHTRFHPKHHKFTYPLFLFGLNLNDDVEDGRLFETKLWPLSWIMEFREQDHLKNGEGLGNPKERRLSERVCALVSERTQQKFAPTRESHLVYLVTHLRYYGYCFNPVSFYYLINRSTGETDTIVGEVSNTPWEEMYPYVLHKDSTDKVQVSAMKTGGTNFVFPKTFHVSPFMEMSYDYDWDFDKWSDKKCRISTRMKVSSSNDSDKNGSLQFTATMQVASQGLNPFGLAWQLARYPTYCLIVQLWIHYEALWLVIKGVAYQPHPKGSETTASRLIGQLATPLFAVMDLVEHVCRRWQMKEE